MNAPDSHDAVGIDVRWTEEASTRLERAPLFLRGMVRRLAEKKARELEVAWDTREKALQKKSPDLWGQIDKAMDAFIKPLQAKSPDPAKVQTAYDTFVAKLQLAVKSDAETKR